MPTAGQRPAATYDPPAAAPAAAKACEGDLLVAVGGTSKVVFGALGALRVELGRRLGLIAAGSHAFAWVTGFPLLEWDEETGRFYASHHPFSSPRPEDVDSLASDTVRNNLGCETGIIAVSSTLGESLDPLVAQRPPDRAFLAAGADGTRHHSMCNRPETGHVVCKSSCRRTAMKRSMVPIALLALVMALLAAGCATSRFSGWIGLDISEAISKFGPPAQTLPVKDGTLYVWHERKDSLAPMPTDFPDSRSREPRIPGPGGWLYRRWAFSADSRGKIGFWTVQESRSPSLFESPVVCGP